MREEEAARAGVRACVRACVRVCMCSNGTQSGSSFFVSPSCWRNSNLVKHKAPAAITDDLYLTMLRSMRESSEMYCNHDSVRSRLMSSTVKLMLMC